MIITEISLIQQIELPVLQLKGDYVTNSAGASSRVLTKSPPFYGIRQFIVVFTRTSPLTEAGILRALITW
jgi:hypothetical protein